MVSVALGFRAISGATQRCGGPKSFFELEMLNWVTLTLEKAIRFSIEWGFRKATLLRVLSTR